MTAGTQAVASENALMSSTTSPTKDKEASESEASPLSGSPAGWVSCLLATDYANLHSVSLLRLFFGFGLGFLFFAIMPTNMSKLFWEIIFCFSFLLVMYL